MIRQDGSRLEVIDEIVIIPPGGSVTDDEDINDELNDEIILNDLQEIAGTFEINRPGIVDSDDECDLEEVDFETVKRNVGDIVNSDDSIDGKVNKLIEQASVLKGSCQWSVGKEQSGLGAEQSTDFLTNLLKTGRY